MRREKLDFIVAQNSTEYFGGYVKWFTGLAALTNHPVTVIFPFDDEMTIIWSGPGVPDNLSLPGVKKKIDVTGTIDLEDAIVHTQSKYLFPSPARRGD